MTQAHARHPGRAPNRLLVAVALLLALLSAPGCLVPTRAGDTPTSASPEPSPHARPETDPAASASEASELGMQSPIDLPAMPPTDESAHRIEIDYVDTAEHLIHRDHTIEVEYDPGSEIAFDGDHYRLAQVHFHTPSEHLVAHERYPVELHLVHRNDGGQLLVVGLLFQVGAPNAFLDRILDDAPRDVGRIDLERQLDVSELFPAEKHFYTYVGSLTTAPYTEGVQWLILSEHPSVSPEQVVRLLVLEGGNAREVQPLNDRPIEGM